MAGRPQKRLHSEHKGVTAYAPEYSTVNPKIHWKLFIILMLPGRPPEMPTRLPESALTKKVAVGTMILPRFYLTRARVAELADALASGASDRKVVEVRVLSRAPISSHSFSNSKKAL